MDAFEIVREETRRMARGCIPLMCFAYAAFALAGYYHPGTLLSLILGTGRYIVRYALTGLLLIGAIKFPPLNAVAVAIPLFFPKIILIASGIFHRKGG